MLVAVIDTYLQEFLLSQVFWLYRGTESHLSALVVVQPVVYQCNGTSNAVLGGVGLRLLVLIISRILAQEKSCV